MTATRRKVLAGAAAALALPAWAQSTKSRLVLLGTGGGPTPKPNRAAPAQVIVVNGASYVIDCGNGAADGAGAIYSGTLRQCSQPPFSTDITCHGSDASVPGFSCQRSLLSRGES